MQEDSLQSPVTSHCEFRVGKASCSTQKFFSDFTSGCEFRSQRMICPESPENFSSIWCQAFQLLTQLSGLQVHDAYVGSCVTLRGNQRNTQRKLQTQFLFGPLGTIRQPAKQFQSATRQVNCLAIRKPPDSVSCRLVQILCRASIIATTLKVHCKRRRDLAGSFAI